MEAWGLCFAHEQVLGKGDALPFQWIVVKGICDWGYGKSSRWQALAAAAATNLVYEAIKDAEVFPAEVFILKCDYKH